MGSFMLQMSWTPSPVTLIDSKHHKVGALDSTLSEAISFISLGIVRLPLALSRQLIMQQEGGRGKRALEGLIELCLLLVTRFWAIYVILLSLCFLTYKMETVLPRQGHFGIEIKGKLV